MEGWVWAGIALWFHAQGRAAEQQNVLLMLSPLLIHPGGPQAVLPSHKSSSAQAGFVHGAGLFILELQAESGFRSQPQHIVPQFPLPQNRADAFS